MLGKLSIIDGAINIASQPITRYMMAETHFDLICVASLIIMPVIPKPQITANMIQPVVPRRLVKRKGVYVPAIKIYIAEWSSFLSFFLAFSPRILWYNVEEVYKSNKEIPKIMKLTRCHWSPFAQALRIRNANPTMLNKIPIPWVTTWAISSLGLYSTL